ncbi:hypothetical protein KKG90_08065 [Candidatus Bipolaricaulota bacterium]|nr:hypothetical protein [Candidatus Bipolaricaulota bacterium]
MSEGVRPRPHEEASESVPRGGFLHAWINGHFQTLADGKRVFYPVGPLGRRGFEVVSTEQELILSLNVRTARRFLMGIVIALMFVLVFSETAHVSWTPILAVSCSLPLQWAYSRMYFWRFTKSMEPIDTPNSFVAYARSMAVTVNPALLLWQTMTIVVMIGAALYLAYRDQDLSRLVLAVFLMAGLTPNVIAFWSWTRMGVPDKR